LLASLSAITPGAAEPISVTAHPIESFGTSDNGNGPLRFLGGIEVTSDDRRFGGLSGIDMLGDDGVAMVSDRGWLVRARLAHEGDRLTGLADAEIDPLFPDGGGSKDVGDVEDIALDPRDPTRGVIVRERQPNAMLSFRFAGGRATDFEPRRVGADDRILRSNRGLESAAYPPAGSPLAGEVVAIAERAPRGMDGIPAWIAGVGQFSIVPNDDFDISSARFLPNGDLLLLERRLAITSGLAMRLRLIQRATIAVGARVDGKILLEAGMASQIDNMEGLAVRQDASGRVILTLVSDDNNSVLQRTLILQFALMVED
jgi:hypothetical protein